MFSIKEGMMEKHAHHWIIEEPTGPVSKGVCKLCGASQEFSNRIGEGKTIGRAVPDSLTTGKRGKK